MFLTLDFLFWQILGLRRGKKKPKDSKQESREEASSTSKKDQTRSSEPNMDQEFDTITEKTDGNSLIPSQNLLTEESSIERTLVDDVDDDLSDTDFSSFNEGQT